jgi:hypothetical protein
LFRKGESYGDDGEMRYTTVHMSRQIGTGGCDIIKSFSIIRWVSLLLLFSVINNSAYGVFILRDNYISSGVRMEITGSIRSITVRGKYHSIHENTCMSLAGLRLASFSFHSSVLHR